MTMMYRVTSTINGLDYETNIWHATQGFRAETTVWDQDANIVDDTGSMMYIDYHPVEIHIQELHRLKLELSDDWLEGYWHEHAEIFDYWAEEEE